MEAPASEAASLHPIGMSGRIKKRRSLEGAVSLKVTHWEAAWGQLTERAMRQRLVAEGFAVSRYHYLPGTYFPPHTHAVDKKDTVLAGRLRIGWEGGGVVLEAGAMIEIPAGVSHSAEVVGAETVVSLDATRNP